MDRKEQTQLVAEETYRKLRLSGLTPVGYKEFCKTFGLGAAWADKHPIPSLKPFTSDEEWPKNDVFLVWWYTSKGFIVGLTCWDKEQNNWKTITPKLNSEEVIEGKAVYWSEIQKPSDKC